MKRIRMIVSAAVVFAAVGTTLAFSNAKFNTAYCIESAAFPVRNSGETGNCPFYQTKLTPTGATQFHLAVIAPNGQSDCDANPECPAIILKKQ